MPYHHDGHASHIDKICFEHAFMRVISSCIVWEGRAIGWNTLHTPPLLSILSPFMSGLITNSPLVRA